MIELSLHDLVARSDLIVRARVLTGRTEWTGQTGKYPVFTYTEVEAIDVFKGAGSKRVFIRTPGGSTGDYNFIVPGSPKLKQGQEYIFFLRDLNSKMSGKPVFELIGFEQSSLPVIKAGKEKAVLVKLKAKPEAGTRAVQIKPDDLSVHIQAILKNRAAMEEDEK